MNISEVKRVLEGNDRQEKLNIISQIGDIFESYHESSDFMELANLLILLVQSDNNDNELKYESLQSLSYAVSYKNFNEIELDNLVKKLDSLSFDCLQLVISILSFTHNEKWLPILQKLLQHENNHVRAEATYAIRELEDYWKNKS